VLKYKRYRFDDAGIRKRLRSNHAIFWNEVADVTTVVADGQYGNYYETTVGSISRREITFRWLSGTWSARSLRKYAAVLDFILRAVPQDIICDKTKFVARWVPGVTQIDMQERALREEPFNTEALKSLANLYWVRLDLRKGRKLFHRCLEISPDDTEALESIALLDIDAEKEPERVIARYQDLLTRAPGNERYLRVLTTLSAYIGSEETQEYARRLLEIKADEIDARFALSFYFFEKEAFGRAKAVLKEIERVAHDDRVREVAKEGINYIERYEADATFRRKEKAKRAAHSVWWFIGALIIPIAGLVAFIVGIIMEIIKKE